MENHLRKILRSARMDSYLWEAETAITLAQEWLIGSKHNIIAKK